MEANEEIRKYEETIKHLFKLLNTVCQERDDARDQLQSLLKNSQPSTTFATSHHLPSIESTKPYLSYKAFSFCSNDLSFASLHSNEKLPSTCFSHARTAELHNLAMPKQPTTTSTTKPCPTRWSQLHGSDDLGTTILDIGLSKYNADHGASLMIDKLVWGKPLPQKGRLLRTVTEAGPLLQTLLIAPLPQWQNPPSSSPCCLAPKGSHGNGSHANVNDSDSVDQNGVIPTSLSLAFPGNSSGASLPYVSGFWLSVKNEPMSCLDKDSDMIHNHILNGKKRKLL